MEKAREMKMEGLKLNGQQRYKVEPKGSRGDAEAHGMGGIELNRPRGLAEESTAIWLA